MCAPDTSCYAISLPLDPPHTAKLLEFCLDPFPTLCELSSLPPSFPRHKILARSRGILACARLQRPALCGLPITPRKVDLAVLDDSLEWCSVGEMGSARPATATGHPAALYTYTKPV